MINEILNKGKKMDRKDIIIKCIECGAKNRIPDGRLKDKPVCGKCHSPLPVSNLAHPVNINDRTFKDEVLSYRGTVLVDCWASWCGPCRTLAPVLEELAFEYAGRLKITKLDVDHNQLTASHFNIKSVPTMLFFKNGELIDTLTGALPKKDIERHLISLLN